MRILFITGSLGEQRDTNAALAVSLAEQLKQSCECHLLGYAEGVADYEQNGVAYHTFAVPAKQRDFEALVCAVLGKNGSVFNKLIGLISHPIRSLRTLKSLFTKTPPIVYAYRAAYYRLADAVVFDRVIAVYFPTYVIDFAGVTRFRSPLELYQLDPYGLHSIKAMSSAANRKKELAAFRKAERVFTTHELARLYSQDAEYRAFEGKIVPLRFPCLSDTRPFENEGLSLEGEPSFCYAGVIGEGYRKSDFLLETFDALFGEFPDARLTVLTASEDGRLAAYAREHPDKLALKGRQPSNVALGTISKADFVINIGNDMHPQQLPSKTISCIASGRPIINFYYTDDCPTLEYMAKYPLALCVDARSDPREAARRIAAFVIENKGRRVDFESVKRAFFDCTPEHAASEMLKALGV